MRVENSMVKKLRISEIENLDSITVYIENFALGGGKITIECFGACWSYGWGAMGERTLEQFFVSANNDYIIGKFAPQLDHKITDYDNLDKHFKNELIELRREGCFSKEKTRELWDRVEDYCENCEGWLQTSNGSDIAYEILGDEWWYDLPKSPNSKYQYLERIINTVKEALKSGLNDA